MNIEQLNYLFKKDSILNLRGYSAKVVLFFLSNDINDVKSNRFKMPQRIMAEKLGVDRTMITRAIKELRDNGIISVKKEGKDNVYSFII